MDDSNLDIMFECKIENINNISDIEIDDVAIFDESDNPIFYLNSDLEKSENKYVGNIEDIKTSGYARNIENIDNNNYKFSYTLFSEKGFPKSKELYIKISKIIISINEDKKEINGEWNFNIKLPAKFYNRNNITYRVSDNDGSIKLEKAILQPTGLNLRFQIINEYLDSKDIAYIFKNIKIEDESGNTYQVNSDSGISVDQWLNFGTTFSITSYEATDNLKLIVPISSEKELIVKLIKND